jgi:hypothetical protein
MLTTTVISQGIAAIAVTVGMLATALTQQLQGRQEKRRNSQSASYIMQDTVH